MRTLPLAGAIAITALLVHSGAASAQVLLETTNGRMLFGSYCAPCHGTDGKGRGSIAGALKTAPPDLSTLTARHGGVYPRARVNQFVTDGTGELSPNHAVKVMPEWGPTLSSFDPSPLHVTDSIAAVVSHLETLQTEIVIASGKLGHGGLNDELFRVGNVWIRIEPGTESYRWLSAGIGREARLTLARDASRFADRRNTRILPGTLFHTEVPSEWPMTHILFFKDDGTGALGPLTIQTEDEGIAGLFGDQENFASSLVVQIRQ